MGIEYVRGDRFFKLEFIKHQMDKVEMMEIAKLLGNPIDVKHPIPDIIGAIVNPQAIAQFELDSPVIEEWCGECGGEIVEIMGYKACTKCKKILFKEKV